MVKPAQITKITNLQSLCNISKKKGVKLNFADEHKSLLQVDIIFDGFDQACPNYQSKFPISLWQLKK